MQAWEFKHPDFKANNKDALDNIRRKAPAPRKPNAATDDMMIPAQQMDMMNGQFVAMQQQLQQVQERYTELSIQNSMMLQELIGLQKTVVNHEHVMQSVMSFLQTVDKQRRDSRIINPFGGPNGQQDGQMDGSHQQIPPTEDDTPASPLLHAAKLLSETNADAMLNPRNLEHMNEMSLRVNSTLTTPPPELLAHRSGARPSSRSAPNSAASSGSTQRDNLDGLVYPVGVNNGIDPMYPEHIQNIPYTMPVKQDPVDATIAPRKKSTTIDPGWIRQPQILLVEDDPTCRRIGGKFLYAFNCSIDLAVGKLRSCANILAN
jgi:hypothetical protein